MGVWNEYAGVQLKVEENCTLAEYGVGDKVPLADGVFVGREGVIVVINSIQEAP